MSQSTNAKSKPMEVLYTDTDPDDRSEIITDVTIRMPGKAGTMMMEVKVDPGVQPSCIPLHNFKTLFPHLCRDGLPKEGLLDNTHNEFQSYNGGDMTFYGHLLIDVKDKVTKKYHPIRFYARFIRPVACVGSGDPVRVLRLYTTNTLDEVCSIYC